MYHLCKNLKKKETATKVLSMASDDVSKLRKEFQEPVTVCSYQFHQLMLHAIRYCIQIYKGQAMKV